MMPDTTRTLSRKLQSIKDDAEAESFIKENSATTSLHSFLNELLAENEVTVSEVIERSGVSKNYIYNILSGARTNPSRDKVIAVCIGLGATFSQTNRALELVKHSALYPRDERDARIAISINQGLKKVTDINISLEHQGLPPLDV